MSTEPATLFTEETYSKSARLSPCGTYRYELYRRWGNGPTLLWIMLNPSTADADIDDPTIRRCIGFSQRDGYGALIVVNLYAYRATDPKALLTADDPEGPDNWWHIQRAIRSSDAVVFAWGATQVPRGHHHVWHSGALIPSPLCLGYTKKGAPRHPLYVKGDQPFVPFVGARTASDSGREVPEGGDR
jgi:hypothetical protein